MPVETRGQKKARLFRSLPDIALEKIFNGSGLSTKCYAVTKEWSRVWRNAECLLKMALRELGIYRSMKRLLVWRPAALAVPKVTKYLC